MTSSPLDTLADAFARAHGFGESYVSIMPPTLDDILNAIIAANNARAAQEQAETVYNGINAQVTAATAAEAATFAQQQATFEAAQDVVRVNAGWFEALEALQNTTAERTNADSTVRQLLELYVAANPI